MSAWVRNGFAFLLGAAVSLGLCVITEANAQQSTVGGWPISIGTFTATYADACVSTPTGTMDYVKIGRVVFLKSRGYGFCTSDSTNTIATGLPAQITPGGNRQFADAVMVMNNGVAALACFVVKNDSTIHFTIQPADVSSCGNDGTWAAANGKAVGMFTVFYVL